MAAKAGARYVSPFVGRLDDIASDGMELVDQIVTIFENYCYETEVIVASIRHPRHVLDAALMGADIATIPFKVIAQLVKHPLTDKGLAQFLEDWGKVFQETPGGGVTLSQWSLPAAAALENTAPTPPSTSVGM